MESDIIVQNPIEVINKLSERGYKPSPACDVLGGPIHGFDIYFKDSRNKVGILYTGNPLSFRLHEEGDALEHHEIIREILASAD